MVIVGKCVVCGEAFTENNPGIPLLGWAREIIGTNGMAHYLCVSKLANENSYALDITPWDIGKAHPALVNLVEQKIISALHVFEPGPGRGDNALYLASQGFDVTASDISSTAVKALKARAKISGLSLNVIQAEVIYGLDGLTNQFDMVFERSFLQTLPPPMRPHYVARIVSLLHDEGTYIGIIRGPRNPPPKTQPFAFTKQELIDLFIPQFDILEISPTVSGHGTNDLSFWLIRARLRK